MSSAADAQAGRLLSRSGNGPAGGQGWDTGLQSPPPHKPGGSKSGLCLRRPPRAVFPGPGPLLGMQLAASLLRCVGRRGATAHGKTAHPDEATPTAQSPLTSCGLSAVWPNAWRPPGGVQSAAGSSCTSTVTCLQCSGPLMGRLASAPADHTPVGFKPLCKPICLVPPPPGSP